MLDEPMPDVRPGFTCTADITTATRKDVVVGADSGRRGPRAGLRRERPGREGAARPTRSGARAEPVAAAATELKPGQTRKETEGVFVVRDGKAEFVPIKMGIAGDKYFEVLSGLKAGDQVITGPYNSVRGMADGDLVKVDNAQEEVNKFLESALHRARRDLGGQAAVVHDRARQHRRGDVDHRRGVADSGAERVGQAGDPQPGRRRLVQHPAVSDHAQRRGVRQGAQQPAHHAARRARDPALQRSD